MLGDIQKNKKSKSGENLKIADLGEKILGHPCLEFRGVFIESPPCKSTRFGAKGPWVGGPFILFCGEIAYFGGPSGGVHDFLCLQNVSVP